MLHGDIGVVPREDCEQVEVRSAGE